MAPGPNRRRGSKASLTATMAAYRSGPSRPGSDQLRERPTPCSPEIAPWYSATRRPTAAASVSMRRTPAADLRSSSGRMCIQPVSYTHLRAHETRHDLVCRLLLEKKKKQKKKKQKKKKQKKKKKKKKQKKKKK